LGFEVEIASQNISYFPSHLKKNSCKFIVTIPVRVPDGKGDVLPHITNGLYWGSNPWFSSY